RRFVEVLTAEESDESETHPSIEARITGLGLDPPTVAAAAALGEAPPAASAVLPRELEERLYETLDHSWFGDAFHALEQLGQDGLVAAEELKALELRERRSFEEDVRRAALTESEKWAGPALALYRALLVGELSEIEEEFIALEIGRLLLELDDDE